MRKIAAFLMVTADGFHEGLNPWEIDWHNVDDEFNAFSVEQLNASDGLIFGRNTYQGMAQYWPAPGAFDDNPAAVVELMNTKPKYVVSRSLRRPEPDWANTRLIGGDGAQELTALKRQRGRDLLVLGSANLTASLIEMGVLDELRLIVNPVLIGAGHSLFGAGKKKIQLTLLTTKVFRSGNVLLTYKPQTQP